MSCSPLADVEVLVVGAGPAGLAIAAALVERNVEVAIVDPAPETSWPNNYGTWIDEIPHGATPVIFEHVYSEAIVRLEARPQPLRLERSYGRVDNGQTRAALRQRLTRSSVPILEGRAEALRHEDARSVVSLRGGEQLTARLVIDATGTGLLARAEETANPGFQTAYGIVARFDGDPLEGHPMVLMDYRVPQGLKPSPVPTFLYGMHLGGDLYFVEETALVARPALSIDLLEDRLYGRLETLGVRPVNVVEIERCHIPMGTAVPRRGQRVLPFGAAAGFVHPATGYQFARTMRAAPLVAAAIARALTEAYLADDVTRRAWQVLWPEDVLRGRRLLTFGMETLLGLDGPGTSRFFEDFFALEDEDWRAYLAGDADHRRIAKIMWRLFASASPKLKMGLTSSAFGASAHLWSAFAPSMPSALGDHHG